jgi:hypothetical protein
MLQFFDSFAKLISNVPDRAVLETLDLECKMLQDDLRQHRVDLTDEANSILNFQLFVRAAKFGHAIRRIVPLPAEHIEFYKKTIIRLIQAEQLPPSAMNNFDFTFVAAV